MQRRKCINGPAQSYLGIGIEHGEFEGWVLENKKDASPPGDFKAEFPARLMHLIQWKSPKPAGAPYREANHVGIYRQNSFRNPDGSEFTDGQMLFAATLMGVRSDSRSPIDVLEWAQPKPYGEPYKLPTNLGIMRVAFEVDDIEAARSRLQRAGHAPIGPVETWDMGEFGERKVVIFRDPDGIMLELIEQVPVPGDRPPFD